MTIRYPSGNVNTILCTWTEDEKRGLGWRWKLLAPHCQQNRVQTPLGLSSSSHLSFQLHLLPSPCQDPCHLAPSWSLCVLGHAIPGPLPGMPYLVFSTGHSPPHPSGLSSHVSSSQSLLLPCLPSIALHVEESTLPCALLFRSLPSVLGCQLLQVRMGSGGSLGPAETLIWSNLPVNTEGVDGNTESQLYSPQPHLHCTTSVHAEPHI